MQQKARAITDIGQGVDVFIGGESHRIGRYGVWAFDPTKGKNQCVAVGDDLDELFEIFGVVPVIRIPDHDKLLKSKGVSQDDHEMD